MRSRFFLTVLLSAFAAASPAAEITGRVVSDRRGVVGATVAALPYESRYAIALRESRSEPAPPPLVTSTTSGDGRFKLVVPGTASPFVVRATFGGLAARTVEGLFEKSDVEDLGEISLSRGETVTGRVVDPAGKPVSGALVRVGRDDTTTTTGKDGLFRFDDLQGRGPQPFLASPALSIQASGFEVQAAAARFSGSPVGVRLKASSARLSGVLKDSNGKPALDAVVRVVGEVVTGWTRTDAAGRFEIPGLAGKPGRLQALGRDGSSLEAAVPAGAPAATFTLTRAASLDGRVTQIDNGRLIASVKVTARAGSTSMVARTGVDGRYRILGLPQGAYRVTFDEKRYVLVDRREIEVAAGEAKTLDIALTPAVTLAGRVSDEKGRPVAGARGVLSPGAESRMGMMFRRAGRDGAADAGFISGLDGTFRATRLAPGSNQKLTVVHQDFERRVIPGLDLVSGATKPLTIDVVLSPGFVLTGVVRDKEAKPIAEAAVTLNRSVEMSGSRGANIVGFARIESVRPQSETDFEGRFEFKGLSAGEYDVTVTRPGFTRSVSNGVKAGDGATSLEVTLNPGASIAGRVVQANGQPVTGYSVTARSAASSGGAIMLGGGRMNGMNMAQVDPDGGFIIEGLVPGAAYDLSIFGAGEFMGEPKKKGVVAPASELEIEVATRGRLAGRVVDAASGAPITDFEARYTRARAGGMRIVIRGGPGEGDRRTPFSSPEGAFAFEDVPPGNWDVTVWAKTYQEARTDGVAVVAGETKNVEVKAARGLVIRGRVVDAKGGRGVQDASVSAQEGGGRRAFNFDPGGQGDGILTDADGRFEIADQAPGAYQLTARHPLFSEGTARITLEDKDAAIEIPLLGGGVIGGGVVSAQGGPLPGAEVSLQNSGEGMGMRALDGQSSLTDGLGRFRFEHLAAGRYQVGATLRTEASPMVDVALNAGDVREDIRLALDAGATVRGLVSGLPENERVGLMVGAQGAQDYFANTRTGANGAFEFAGVPKGTLTLRATGGDLVLGSSRTAVKEVVIPEGQLEVTTEIVFEDGLSISGTVTRRGAPVAGARVSAFVRGTRRQGSARADDNGIFKIVGLEAGQVDVTAFAENLEGQVSRLVELKADTSIDLVIPTAALAGTVVDAAGGLPLEATVELQPANPAQGNPAMRLAATTDSSGRFSFNDLEAVDYRVTVRRSGYESVTKTVKATDGGEDLRIELKRGSGLSIEAKDAQMGFGLRSLFVRIQAGTVDSFLGPVSLDGEGKGEIPGIPPGSYVVTAQASGYAPLRVPDVMAPSMLLRLSFTPGGTVEFRTTEEFLAGGAKAGQLLSTSGAPVGMGQGGPNSFRLSRLTQRMDNLAPGRYRLTLEGGIEKTFEVSEGGVAMVTIP